MSDTTLCSCRYTFGNLMREARTQIPRFAAHPQDFLAGFCRSAHVTGPMRLAIQLRLARQMGCPVCVALFTRLAGRLGWTPQAVESALAGRPDGLPSEVYAAIAWAGAVLDNDGLAPAEIPAPAETLSEVQRRHIERAMQLESVIHATGLMFLPHRLIEQARGAGCQAG